SGLIWIAGSLQVPTVGLYGTDYIPAYTSIQPVNPNAVYLQAEGPVSQVTVEEVLALCEHVCQFAIRQPRSAKPHKHDQSGMKAPKSEEPKQTLAGRLNSLSTNQRLDYLVSRFGCDNVSELYRRASEAGLATILDGPRLQQLAALLNSC